MCPYKQSLAVNYNSFYSFTYKLLYKLIANTPLSNYIIIYIVQLLNWVRVYFLIFILKGPIHTKPKF